MTCVAILFIYLLLDTLYFDIWIFPKHKCFHARPENQTFIHSWPIGQLEILKKKLFSNKTQK